MCHKKNKDKLKEKPYMFVNFYTKWIDFFNP
jgi:hypothetical protein